MGEERKKRFLTKSLYTAGLNCHKALWLNVNKADQQAISESARANMDRGKELGVQAWGVFPGGTEVPFGKSEYDRMIKDTCDLIDQGVQTIYEATFCHQDVLVRVDILHKGRDGWEMHEVKGAWGVKPYHLHDLAVQYFVVKGSDIDVKKATIIHVNGTAKKAGETDPAKLFKIIDKTEEVIMNQTGILENVGEMCTVLEGGEPDLAMDERCKSPFMCNFYDYCRSAHIEQSNEEV